MNERIQELWAKAVDIAVPETYTNLSWGQIEKIKTVFAELIIQECAYFVAQNTLEDQGMWGKIVRHFGVDE